MLCLAFLLLATISRHQLFPVQQSVLPFLLRTHYEALSMAVNLDTCKIVDIKLSSVIMESLATSLISLASKEEHCKELLVIFEDFKVNKYICEVLVVVLALIEGLNESIRAKSEEVADYEECAVHCFQVYTNVIIIWSSIRSISDTPISEDNRPIRGNFLAQLVQSTLHFAQHRYRLLSETALGCLFVAISGIHDAKEWRKYYPGCSSSLFSLCMAADAQSSASVRYAALVCLLRLTMLVTADQEYFNRVLLQKLGKIAVGMSVQEDPMIAARRSS